MTTYQSNNPITSSMTVAAKSGGPTPSFRLLFSCISWRHIIFLLIPAIISSIVAGGIAPFMTRVIGQAFDAFTRFPLTPNPPQEAKSALLKSMSIVAIELVALAVGALILSSFTSCLWIWMGERNVREIRQRVYTSVMHKDMAWFDMKLGGERSVKDEDGDGPLGAGGLMAKFTRETDEVRNATSLASGILVQSLTTVIAAIILAFLRSPILTLIILSSIPILIFIQFLSNTFSSPLLARERLYSGRAATLVDRAFASISTVKAFNAESNECTSLSSTLHTLNRTELRTNIIFGLSSASSQFVTLSMFVQAFWFGSKLVREGKLSAGDVMAVFFACLIAVGSLQMCIPQFIILTKGKLAMAALMSLVVSDRTQSPPSPPANTDTRTGRRSPTIRVAGEFSMINVSFSYPSRPTIRVLNGINMFIPANETTFIVGGSGSGKSTIAQLLLRMYDPSSGGITLDNTPLSSFNEDELRKHVSCVSQDCIVFDTTVYHNVAIGGVIAKGKKVTREEVEEACKVALIHQFVSDLPDGYETRVGYGGVTMSGGQRQRLALARAKLRDPAILILDEATCALDPTSRILVFEALKRWRRNKTTIVITHDLSQISKRDFVYVLKEGRIVENGYRADLEASSEGVFRGMMESQGGSGGYLPEKDLDATSEGSSGSLMESVEAEIEMLRAREEKFRYQEEKEKNRKTIGNWIFDAVAELTTQGMHDEKENELVKRSMFDVPPSAFTARNEFHAHHNGEGHHVDDETDRMRRRSSVDAYSARSSLAQSFTRYGPLGDLKVARSDSTFHLHHPHALSSETIMQDVDLGDEKKSLEESGNFSARRRSAERRKRMTMSTSQVSGSEKSDQIVTVKVEGTLPPDLQSRQTNSISSGGGDTNRPSFWRLVRDVYPTVPYKPFVFLGILACLASGAITPIFSFLLSRLLFEVSIGATDISTINIYGGIILGVAAADGFFVGLKYFIMETAGIWWTTKLRNLSFGRLLSQDRKFFDNSRHSPQRLGQILIKDGDDARNLIAVVLGQCLVVTSMLGAGLVWALVEGWQLTLVGVALAPIFALVMTFQTGLVGKCELRNKRARESIAKAYYEAISNVRGVRFMGLEGAFKLRFDKAVSNALVAGSRGAFVEGCTYGVANSLIYLAEALLFYVGAVFIAKGTYTYLQMIEVLNLVVFTVILASQMMAFTQKIAKSTQAARDFNQLLQLSLDTDESYGIHKTRIKGDVMFHQVSFSYPERPGIPVLKDFSMNIHDGECVAVVGASGCGKSTISALLQRLYEPDSGTIAIGPSKLHWIDVQHLRDHVAIVSQNPHLFDASIAENIAYGNINLTEMDVRRAAMAANIHEFIMSLPHGYDTMIGENASLISGGQAQRLQIARALARPSKILILDECTSALDPANQAAVMETIQHSKIGRTTIIITHRVPLMRMCDRILVLHDGEIREQGSYETLMAQKGLFAKLACSGEWRAV